MSFSSKSASSIPTIRAAGRCRSARRDRPVLRRRASSLRPTSWSGSRSSRELDRGAAPKEQQLLSRRSNQGEKAANLEAYKAQLAEMEQSFGAMLRQLPEQDRSAEPAGRHLADRARPRASKRSCSSRARRHEGFLRRAADQDPADRRLSTRSASSSSGIAALPRIVTLHDIEITPRSARTQARPAGARRDGQDLSLPRRRRTGRGQPQDKAPAEAAQERARHADRTEHRSSVTHDQIHR